MMKFSVPENPTSFLFQRLAEGLVNQKKSDCYSMKRKYFRMLKKTWFLRRMHLFLDENESPGIF